ncbi:MAG: AAA family ATPase, partial [Bradymonadaceae bacterium]
MAIADDDATGDADVRSVAEGELRAFDEEPFYLETGDEISVFESAHERQLGVLLKGPTGCGKTRFVEHMAWRLERPLVTVACHDDLSATDLTGRYLVQSGDTVWRDGPLTRAVRHGAICYLDEI